jgi:hypothetical protein
MFLRKCREYRELERQYTAADADYIRALSVEGWEGARVEALRAVRSHALEAMLEHERTHQCVRKALTYGVGS